jgi:tetratricopeptide (TPR) repeat protein
VAPDHELEVVRSMFNAGNFKLALERAQDAMAMANFSDAQRVELHKFAGVAAFNLGDTATADRHFLQLLQINPDFVLDPFAVPPPAIKLFEEVKRKNADALNLIRQNIALREEQVRREAAEALRRKQLEDAERERLQALSANRQVKTVERHPWILNWLPFGIGQLSQGRYDWGITFLVLEVVTALTSAIAYAVIESMFQEVPVPIHGAYNPQTGKFEDLTVIVHAIPTMRAPDENVWSNVKWVSGGAFYAIAALGIVESLLHNKGDVVTVTTEPASTPASPSLHFSLFPMPGGMSAGVSIRF